MDTREFTSPMGKAVDELLEGSFGVSCDGGIISEEHLPDEDIKFVCARVIY